MTTKKSIIQAFFIVVSKNCAVYLIYVVNSENREKVDRLNDTNTTHLQRRAY